MISERPWRVCDLAGQKFGRLTALSQGPKLGKKNRISWQCSCECGGSAIVTSSNLRSGGTTSCGCKVSEVAREKAMKRNFVHGHNTVALQSPTWHSWNCMTKRCRLESHISYHRYGGRGIVVCERWKKFENFLEDMGERPEGKTIDRIDNDGNYEKLNCKWSTRSEQQRNKSPFKWKRNRI